MDDPMRQCENDTGIETALLWPPTPKRGPFFSRCQNLNASTSNSAGNNGKKTKNCRDTPV
jgi:hypothetical protein